MEKKNFELVVKNLDISTTDNQDKLFIKGFANKYKDNTGNLVVDRSGDIVPPENYNLTNYMKNPVILYQHNQNDIIGKAVNVNLTDKGLEIEAFILKDLNPTAFKAVQEGILQAFSIGFTANDYEELDDGTWVWKGVELLEVSVVSVPDNQDSLFTVLADSPCQNGGVCLMSMKNDIVKKDVDISNSKNVDNKKETNMQTKAIKNSEISMTKWSNVDKTALGDALYAKGDKSYINEAYLVVGDYEKRTTWKFPHHELIGEDLVVNKEGVVAAYAALQGARQNPNISPSQKKEAARHLLKHYREMERQDAIGSIPQELQDMAKNLEDMIKEFDEQIESAFSDINDNVEATTKENEVEEQKSVEPENTDEPNEPENENTDETTDDEPEKVEEKSETQKQITVEDVEMFILEKSNDMEGLDYLYKLYADLEGLINTRLTQLLANPAEKE